MEKDGNMTSPEYKIKTKGSIVLMQAFALSAALVVLFVLAYLLTADLVAQSVPAQTGSFLQVWGPPVLISLAVSVLCCLLMFLFKVKRIVPLAFAMLVVYYAVLQIAVRTGYSGTPEAMDIFAQMIRLYTLPPVIVGNLVAWPSYLFYFKKRDIPVEHIPRMR